jgi:hypothetical protein
MAFFAGLLLLDLLDVWRQIAGVRLRGGIAPASSIRLFP